MRFNSLFLSLLAHGAASTQTVKVKNGTIHGGTCVSSKANFFHSIPFALPPVGPLRFAAPEPFDQAFNGTLNATRAAPSCIQFGSELVESGPQSEDCLYLDVWAPVNADSKSALPVKVFIYGGSNEAGGISDPMYDGCNAAVDSIIVTINYRVGPMGFLGLQKAGLTGNYAVQDVLLGLHWIQENIKAFGGDTEKVLLFGQSAGAALSFLISTLPQAPSLISAVAAESGGGRGTMPISIAQPYFEKFALSLGCGVDDVKCLRAKSAREMQDAFPDSDPLAITLAYAKGFAPLVDGEVVPADPAAVGVRVPAIFGSTTSDGSLFVLSSFQDAFPPTKDNCTSFIESNFGSFAPAVESAYPISKFANISSAALAPYFAMTAIWTHASYTCSAHRGLVKAAEKGLAGYAYLWDVAPTCPWTAGLTDRIQKLLGATHTAEIPFVFRNTDGLPFPNGTCNFTGVEKEISNVVADAWTAMAESQSPSTRSQFSWPTFHANSSMGLVASNKHGAVVNEIDYSFCNLWDTINEALLGNSTGLQLG